MMEFGTLSHQQIGLHIKKFALEIHLKITEPGIVLMKRICELIN
jgi:hypothetical protein